MLRFGAEAFKYLASSETERLVAGLATEMRAGFKVITERMEEIEKQKTGESKKPDVVHLAKSYAAAALKPTTSTPDENKMEKAMDRAADNGCYSVVHASNSGESTKKQAEEWIEVISAKQRRLNIRLNSVRTTNRNNVSIYFKDAKEQAKFMGSIEKDPIKGADIRSSAARKVSFAVRGVPAEYDEEKLVRELMHLNGDHEYVKEEKLVVKDARQIKEGTMDDRRVKPSG